MVSLSLLLSAAGCASESTAGMTEERPSLSSSTNDGATVAVPLSPAPASSREEVASDPQPTPGPTPKVTLEPLISSPRIVIKKSERILELWDGERLYGSYPIGLGREPAGDKQVEGDGRTPEGDYYVCMRNSKSKYYLSLGVSYPNKEDAAAALAAGLIDQNTYQQIAGAIDHESRPPWDTTLGGAIMIHGNGSSSDWTAGCIAVENDVMDILWRHCPNKTSIQIKP